MVTSNEFLCESLPQPLESGAAEERDENGDDNVVRGVFANLVSQPVEEAGEAVVDDGEGALAHFVT